MPIERGKTIHEVWNTKTADALGLKLPEASRPRRTLLERIRRKLWTGAGSPNQTSMPPLRLCRELVPSDAVLAFLHNFPGLFQLLHQVERRRTAQSKPLLNL